MSCDNRKLIGMRTKEETETVKIKETQYQVIPIADLIISETVTARPFYHHHHRSAMAISPLQEIA